MDVPIEITGPFVGVAHLPDPEPIPSGTISVAPLPVWENMTQKVAWFAEGDPPVRITGQTFLAKALISGTDIHLRLFGQIKRPESLVGVDGGWYWIVAPPLMPSDYAFMDVGVAYLGRGYKQRGISGANVFWEELPENSGNMVLKIKYSTGANKNGRIDRFWPFQGDQGWEAGDYFRAEIEYEGVPQV